MLHCMSGRWHDVLSAISLLDCKRKRTHTTYSRTRVHFRRLSRAEIQWYLSTGEYCDKAGAYAIQGRASLFVDRIEGCYFNIVGLPIFTLETLCRKMGIDFKTQLNSTSPICGS